MLAHRKETGPSSILVVVFALERCRSRPGRLFGSRRGLASKVFVRSFGGLGLLRVVSGAGLYFYQPVVHFPNISYITPSIVLKVAELAV